MMVSFRITTNAETSRMPITRRFRRDSSAVKPPFVACLGCAEALFVNGSLLTGGSSGGVRVVVGRWAQKRRGNGGILA